MADVLKHHPACYMPEVATTPSRKGDGWFHRCTSCSAIAVIGFDGSALFGETEPANLASLCAPLVVSRWRCREHGGPVNANGKGCPQCADRVEASRERRRQRRSRRQARQ